MKIKLPISFDTFIESIQRVKKNDNEIDYHKEELLIYRLEKKLNKSNEEVKKMISTELLTLLGRVPFTNK